MGRVLTAAVLILGGVASAAPACSASQDSAAARAAALGAVRERMNGVVWLYRVRGYHDVGYEVRLSSVSVQGAGAVARGTIGAWATEPDRSRVNRQTYQGTVTLVRAGVCAWKATAYRQS